MRTHSILALCLALIACGDSDGGDETEDGTTNENTVADSPECQAWCDNIADLNCPGGTCDKNFFCRVEVEDGECPESVRAFLKCEVEEGTFMCTENGWTGGSSCPRDNSICPQ